MSEKDPKKDEKRKSDSWDTKDSDLHEDRELSKGEKKDRRK
jgi:hypothetical protein